MWCDEPSDPRTRPFLGVAMTLEQVMTLFVAPAAFVQSGKVMASDSLVCSYDDFTRFYGTAAGADEWNFARRVHQYLFLALHHVQKITNFLQRRRKLVFF